MMKESLTQALPLGAVGLVVGAAAGWYGLIRAASTSEFASIGAAFYLSLLVLLPAALFVLTRQQMNSMAAAQQASLGSTMLKFLFSGLVGIIAASVFFLVTAIQIPAVFGGKSAADILVQLQPAIGWGKVLLVAGATMLSALPLSLWFNRSA